MQLLTFDVAGESYAVESAKVVEVLPLVPTRPIPHMPDHLLGVFTYRGKFLPLVDLGRLIAGEPPAARLSTRVIVVEVCPPSHDPGEEAGEAAPQPVRFGVVAENVVTIHSIDEDAPAAAAKPLATEPYLGRLIRLHGHTLQMLLPEHLLPAKLLAGLFPEHHEASHGDQRIGPAGG